MSLDGEYKTAERERNGASIGMARQKDRQYDSAHLGIHELRCLFYMCSKQSIDVCFRGGKEGPMGPAHEAVTRQTGA